MSESKEMKTSLEIERRTSHPFLPSHYIPNINIQKPPPMKAKSKI